MKNPHEATSEHIANVCAYLSDQYRDACEQTAAQEREILNLRGEIIHMKCEPEQSDEQLRSTVTRQYAEIVKLRANAQALAEKNKTHVTLLQRIEYRVREGINAFLPRDVLCDVRAMFDQAKGESHE